MVPENDISLTTGRFTPSLRFAKVIALRAAESKFGARIKSLTYERCCILMVHKFLDIFRFAIVPPTKIKCPRSLTRWGPSRVSDYLPAAALIALTGVVAIMV